MATCFTHYMVTLGTFKYMRTKIRIANLLIFKSHCVA
jgi:hypothetical protein